MRNEQQVLDQLLAFARQQESIRVVVMNGSRVNPNAPRDFFQDYDVVYYVTDPRKFLDDRRWIANFGELVILQQNDFIVDGTESFIFLMLFTDGVRIDLSFQPLSKLVHVAEDSLTVVLLDKDGCIPPLPPPSDTGYYLKRPTQKEFDEAINEILWCSNNVAKGLWRGELAYTKYMYEVIIRECIIKTLSWYVAVQHDWKIDPGKFGKWLEKYLPYELWESYKKTYAGASEQETWDAIFEGLCLIGQVGPEIAEALGYHYPHEDHYRMIAYLQHVRALPKDAKAY